MRKIPIDCLLYDTVYDSDFPENQYYILLFDAIPSIYKDKTLYHESAIEYFLSMGFTTEWKIDAERMGYNSSYCLILINRRDRIIIKIDTTNIKKDQVVTLQFCYDINFGEFHTQIDLEKINTSFKREKKRSNINLVRSDMGQLDTEEYDIPIPAIDLELNYGSDFLKIHELIIKRLNTDKDKGIILLHGDPGTGKCVMGDTKVKIRNKITGEISEINIEDLM